MHVTAKVHVFAQYGLSFMFCFFYLLRQQLLLLQPGAELIVFANLRFQCGGASGLVVAVARVDLQIVDLCVYTILIYIVKYL